MRWAMFVACAVWFTGCGDGSSSTPAGTGPDATDAPTGLDANVEALGADVDAFVETKEPETDTSSSDEDASSSDADNSDTSASDSESDELDLDADAGTDGGTYRNSLSICWNDATCPRVMAIAHGGAWDPVSAPYDSNAAIAKAYDVGIDGVKIDVRVTKDNVPVISHSSPIETYESLDCSGKKIEEMTAAEVQACHRAPSFTETFQRLDDVLAYLSGKMVVQLCVKLSSDCARTVEVVHSSQAADFAFLEITTSTLQDIIPSIPGADSVYYVIDIGTNLAEVDTLLDTIKNPRAIMYEFDPSVQVDTLVTTRLHPAGVRSFTYDNSATAGVAELQALFEGGFDVVSAQTAANDVQARIAVNQSRGVSPP